MNIVTIEFNGTETIITVNDEYICAIKGRLHDQKLPLVGNQDSGINRRYGNCHGHVWITEKEQKKAE